MMTALGKIFSDSNYDSCYIIAEMSANHNQNFERAKEIVVAAAKAGADAIKLQTYTADTLTFESTDDSFMIKGTLWDKNSLYDLYQAAYTPWEWQEPLKDFANSLGLDCFSTPFDATAVDFLEKINMPCYKIASFEVVDIPLLKKIGSTGKPVILSTGMATLAEIDEAVTTLRMNGSKNIILLKCTSAYPSNPEEANLRTIRHLSETFKCKAGVSDHTLGTAVAVAAVALGAKVVEKHFTLSRKDGGPDAAFSMEPLEFRRMVDDIRVVEKALGGICYEITPSQREITPFRRSLYVSQDIEEGEVFTSAHVQSVRPAYGLHPRYYDLVLSSKAAKSMKKGTPLSFSSLR